MKLYPQSVCQIALLVLCCVMITVRESDSAFVPGRCLCPHTQSGVRGKLVDLKVYHKSASCDKVTVIVTTITNEQVCLNPEGPMGKQLINCWNKVHKLGLDVKLCLERRGSRGKGSQRSRQRSGSHSRRASSSNSQ
ncbi:growth-regulated protein homolog gamma-like [Scomber scombrus]|uniref:growth-regulated protein homolog gamma-like n=1 Tax=Scomber scombrus TaxID=13677 RepID=UPI002DD94A6A|nr:growth-regulated protein homolog gamma-like [Scomber scombrus]